MRASEILAAARTDIESRLEKLGYRKAAPAPAPAPVAPAAPATPAPTLDNRMAGSAAVQADPFAGLDERDARRLRAIKALEGLSAPKA
jgi:hypothetical protein